jgi:amino acid transporter
VAIIVAGFGMFGNPLPAAENPTMFSSNPPLGMLGLGMVFVLLTFGGWNESAYISAELKGTSKTIVTVIVASLAVITVIYLLVNIALINGLGLKVLASSKAAPADLLGLAFGPLGNLSQNNWNCKTNLKNTSGYQNVVWRKDRNKWTVRLQINGKVKAFGAFDDIEEANKAAIKLRKELHGEFVSIAH